VFLEASGKDVGVSLPQQVAQRLAGIVQEQLGPMDGIAQHSITSLSKRTLLSEEQVAALIRDGALVALERGGHDDGAVRFAVGDIEAVRAAALEDMVRSTIMQHGNDADVKRNPNKLVQLARAAVRKRVHG
jgi:hypothetical protein